MPVRAILVPQWAGRDATAELDTALTLARRLEAHIKALFVRPDPAPLLAAMPINGMGRIDAATIERQGKKAAETAHTAFEAWRTGHRLASTLVDFRLASTFAAWSEQEGEIETVLVQNGRVSDLIVLPRPGAGDVTAERAFDAAVFAAGRPTIATAQQPAGDLLRHVLVAWNGSLEATHALSQSLELLHAAERVSIFSAPEIGQLQLDLKEYLHWHAIRAVFIEPQAGSGPVGAALFASAERVEATLVVMGAYTHSRLRQAVLGGVTHHALHQARIPVLMTH